MLVHFAFKTRHGQLPRKIVHPCWRKLYFDCVNWLKMHPDWLIGSHPVIYCSAYPRLTTLVYVCLLIVSYFLSLTERKSKSLISLRIAFSFCFFFYNFFLQIDFFAWCHIQGNAPKSHALRLKPFAPKDYRQRRVMLSCYRTHIPHSVNQVPIITELKVNALSNKSNKK